MILSTRRTGRAAVLAWALGMSGCSDETIAPAPRELALAADGYSLTFDANEPSITLFRGDEQLTVIDGAGLVLGTVDAVDDSVNYDPYPLVAAVPGYFAPAGATFHAARKVFAAKLEGQTITAEVEHEGGLKSLLTITAEGEGSFRVSLVPVDSSRVVWARFGAEVDGDEAFYGLGEHFDDVNQRGKLRAMQIVVDALESANNEAHVPVPLLIGTRGWGMFVETPQSGVFDVAASDAERVEATFGLGADAEQGLTLHLFAAQHPLDVTQRYYELTGYPRLPAPWALGPLVWRDENDDQAQVEADLDTMRELDLATSGIWIDRPYATGVNTFDFVATKFPDPAAMIDKAHALGFRVSLWHTPYLDEADPATASLRAEAETNGYYPVETGIQFNNWGKPIDFTADGAIDWWQANLAAYTALGIEGYKLDYAEDIIPGSLFGVRNVYHFHDGSDERTMQRGYTLLYHQTYAETLPEAGGFLLCRAGRFGDQINGPVIWPGDLDARFWKHREQVTEDGKTFLAVGGLPASVVAGLTLGPSGFPFFGADTGGYRHSPPDIETFRRWFEQTALSTVMQIGTSSNDVAWEFGDPELLDAYRVYTRLHLRLFPYEWSLAHEMLATGRPIQRAFGLVYPELGQHPNDEYLFGDALLVAPVVEPGVDERSIAVPEGTWVGFWDGSTLEGPDQAVVPAPLGTLPLYLRAGSLVPMLRPSIDTLAPTTEPATVDSFATSAGLLYVLTSPGPSASFTLYDGAAVHHHETASTLSFGFEPGDVFSQGAVFEIIAFGSAAPSAVRVASDTIELSPSLALFDASEQAAFFDPADRGGTLWVKAAGATAIAIER